MAKHPFLVDLEPHQLKRLRELSNFTKIAVAQYIREGVDWIIEQNKSVQTPGRAEKRQIIELQPEDTDSEE